MKCRGGLRYSGMAPPGTKPRLVPSHPVQMPVMQPPKPIPAPMPAHELAGLVERAREGDVAAFEKVIGKSQPKVYTFAFAFTGSPDVAQDLAQEALVKVYRSLGSFRFQSAFSTWLY